MSALRAFELVVAAGAVAASGGLAWRAADDLYHGACEDAHGAASARRRLWAQRMRIYTLTGLSAVGVGAVVAFQRAFTGGGVLRLSAGVLAFGVFAWVSARSARRASRQENKRARVRERMRARMRARMHQRQRRRAEVHSAEEERRRAHRGRSTSRRARRQEEEVRRALRTLGLRKGATPDEVKRAWRAHAFRHHPDRHVSADEAQRERHAEAFRRAQRAYDTLSRRIDA